MAKLYFRYSAMGAGKTLDLLKVAFNYEERGQNVLLLTSSKDTRYSNNIIKSRVGIEKEAIAVKDDTSLLDIITLNNMIKPLHCVLIDEVQFLATNQIEQLTDVVDFLNIPIICYGLRVDYRGLPFESTSYLMAIADSIEELKTICFCGKKAIMNTLIVNGEIVKEGEQVVIDDNKDNKQYTSLCRYHWKHGIYK